MAPGKRKSPFIGAVDTATQPVLYKRYTDISDVLLVPNKAAGKNEADSSACPDKPLEEMSKSELLQLIKGGKLAGINKKRKHSSEANQQDDAKEDELPESVDSGEHEKLHDTLQEEHNLDDVTASKDAKKRKSKKKEEKAASKAPSGPSNAAEAEKIRDIMGIRKGKAEAPKQANGFSFGFQPGAEANGEADVSDELEEEEEEEAAQPDEEAAPIPAQNGHAKESASSVQVPESTGNSDLDSKLRRVLGQKSDHVARRIFVGGMPFSYDEDEVRDYWSYCGEIEDLDLMRFPDTGRFKGIAFITFADEAGYKEALKCNGELIDEHKLKVEPCISAGPKANGKAKREERLTQHRHHSSPAPKTPGYHVAYVGNLAFEVTPGQLRELFTSCEITVVRLHTDKDTGKSKGYAHVHFANEESLDRAIEFSGTKLKGRAIKIGYAQPKKE